RTGAGPGAGRRKRGGSECRNWSSPEGRAGLCFPPPSPREDSGMKGDSGAARESRLRPGLHGICLRKNMSDHFRGRPQVFGLADLLQWMELNRRTGRLTLGQGRDRRIVDWREGQIIYVSGSLPRHRLGVHLLRSGALPAATLYDLLARNFTTSVNL